MAGPAASTDAPSARGAVVEPLADAAAHFPDMRPAPVPIAGLTPQDARLAHAIHRTVLQRWLTLEYLLDRHLTQPLRKLEPTLAAILLSGAAQIALMQRVPTFAAVDEAVSLAKARVRKKAGGLVNAVLRRLAGQIAAIEPDAEWTPAADQLPLEAGRVRLTDPALPDPADHARYLAVATSHGPALLQHWLEHLGQPPTESLCIAGLRHPPTIVAVEPAFDPRDAAEHWQWHDRPGFIVWRTGHNALVNFLARHPARRVQDPAAALAAQATANRPVRSALDLCAGRGTKTRQLAALHPDARITATDASADRRAELDEWARSLDRVAVADYEAVPTGPYDLVLLDVPCSNTGVLARRHEARYRFTRRNLRELIDRQRQIIDTAIPKVAPGGYLLYTTCSIDPAENNEQTDYIERQTGGEVVAEDRWLPAGHDTDYHDGSYHALVQLTHP